MLMPVPAVLDTIAAQVQSLPTTTDHAGSHCCWFVHACQQLAPPLSILTSMGPMPAIQKIRMAGNVAGVSLLPYSCMTANCGLWTTYGMLQHQASIWAPNMVGMMLALYYFGEFIKIAYKPAPSLSAEELSSSSSSSMLLQHILSLAAVAFGTAAAVSSHQIEASLFGQAADFLFIISLLASLQTVIQTKSAENIVLPVTILSMMACFCRSVSGFEMQDINIVLPNVIGFLLGMVQVAVKLLYEMDVAIKRTAAVTDDALSFGFMKPLEDDMDERQEPGLATP